MWNKIDIAWSLPYWKMQSWVIWNASCQGSLIARIFHRFRPCGLSCPQGKDLTWNYINAKSRLLLVLPPCTLHHLGKLVLPGLHQHPTLDAVRTQPQQHWDQIVLRHSFWGQHLQQPLKPGPTTFASHTYTEACELRLNLIYWNARLQWTGFASKSATEKKDHSSEHKNTNRRRIRSPAPSSLDMNLEAGLV